MPKNLYTGPDTHVSPDKTKNELVVGSSETTDYPKYKYHATEAAVVVFDADGETALGGEWKDSPAEFEEAAAE